MAARSARSFLQAGTKSFGVLRKISGKNNIQSCLKSLHRTSSSSLQGNPALSAILQNLTKRSSPSFVSHIRRLQDIAINIDTATCDMSSNQDNSQDISLLEQCSEDDDEQFRKKGKDIHSQIKDEVKFAQLNGNIFAIVYIGGSQFKVAMNDIIIVNKLNAEVGSKIKLEKVLLVGGEHFTIVGRPLVECNTVDVQATIMEHTKTEKIIVFKKKRRKGYKRTQGHRQALSVLRINKIGVNSTSL
ncbi:50S ribosomal protein L21, mitochondrial-like [Dendronephthya gigantea]|uniref:50S ribosomal protein L21, mitochondrial-like n=1 Tax=Dendronephthya gigantea TaxID=151771 RepID=UPI00106C6B84|nr:50S ribosomal protein L21, mitochondrial-like [Dendronephthya gigantea]